MKLNDEELRQYYAAQGIQRSDLLSAAPLTLAELPPDVQLTEAERREVLQIIALWNRLDDLEKKRYLQPIYGCVPFVVRDVLRFYAGWWGGNPAEIIPARRADVARDVVSTAGRDALFAKAESLRASGELRRALHVAMLLVQADDADAGARDLVARICDGIVEVEPSFIARNFYLVAAAQARATKS